MPTGPDRPEPRWHDLLSLASHEMRTPLSVIQGYLRMILKDQSLGEQHQHMLREIEKSAARLTSLAAEMSELARIERGEKTISRTSAVALGPLISDAIAGLPPMADGREITVELIDEAPGATVAGNPVMLRSALSAILFALRRELVTSTELLVRLRRADGGGQPAVRISIAGGEQIAGVEQASGASLATFDEWRGGVGLGLPIARRVVNAHDGSLWSPAADGMASAVIELPVNAS